MAEYIEREAAHRMITGLTRYSWASPISSERRVTVDADDVNFGLDKIPAADVAPVVHGRWVPYENKQDKGFHFCPVCKGRRLITKMEVKRKDGNKTVIYIEYKKEP